MIPEYIEQARRSREPGNQIRPRRVNWRKRLGRWAGAATVFIALVFLGSLVYALIVMAVAAAAGFMDARG